MCITYSFRRLVSTIMLNFQDTNFQMKFESIYGNAVKNSRYQRVFQNHQKEKFKCPKSLQKLPLKSDSDWVYRHIQKIYSKTKKYTVLYIF